jgi:hypothetical protein
MLRDANMLVPDAEQPPADQDNDRGDNGDLCPEDEEYFDRLDQSGCSHQGKGNIFKFIKSGCIEKSLFHQLIFISL